MKNFLLVTALATALTAGAAQSTFAQSGFATNEQLDALSAEMSQIGSNLQNSINSAHEAMLAMGDDVTTSEKIKQIDAYFDSVEQQARDVLATVSLNSSFMDALDDTRAEISTLMSRFELDPPSPNRDARLLRLQELSQIFDKQYDEVQRAERTIVEQISKNNEARNEIIKDAQVQSVAVIVERLGKVTEGLTDMANVLKDIGEAAISGNSELNSIPQN